MKRASARSLLSEFLDRHNSSELLRFEEIAEEKLRRKI
jgi:hypothetical protein